MEITDVPDLKPGPGEVLVRLAAAGVNPVDTYVVSGSYANRPSLPYTPGSDGAGAVAAIGAGVAGLTVGQRVYVAGSLTGTYAQQALCRPSSVHPLPDRITFQQGAAIGVPYGTAFRALFQKAHALPGETVLVFGASGGVGIAAVQLARAFGLAVLATAGTEKGRRLILDNGAHHAIDHTSGDVADQVRSLTAGRGVNIILEMLANKNLATDLRMLGTGGRVVVIGNRGTIEINPRDAMSRDASILGMLLSNASDPEMASIHAGLFAALEDGVARPVIAREIPLREAPRAHIGVMTPGASGKIVLLTD
jgi:NADPH2:quinone reductase